MIAGETIGGAVPVMADNGQPVLQGTDNGTPTRRTAVRSKHETGVLADPNTSGRGSLGVFGVGQDFGVRGEGGNGLGVGVAGVGGSTGGAGVAGAGGAPNGIGVAGDGGPGDGVGVVGAGGGNGSAFGRFSEARVIRVRS